MLEINLLPWRVLKKERQKKYFFFVTFFSLLILSLILAAEDLALVKRNENMFNRKSRLQKEINKLNIKIKKIEKISIQEKKIIKKINILNKMKALGWDNILVFYELSKIFTEGIYLKKLKRKNNKFFIFGYVDSAEKLLSLLKRLRSNSRFENTLLNKTKKNNFLHFLIVFELNMNNRRGILSK